MNKTQRIWRQYKRALNRLGKCMEHYQPKYDFSTLLNISFKKAEEAYKKIFKKDYMNKTDKRAILDKTVELLVESILKK